MNQPYVCVIGASIIDLTGFTIKPLVPEDYNLGKIKISMGGVARNIAENLARLNIAVKLISAIGEDDFGSKIKKHGEKAGIDFSHSLISKKMATATNIALLNPQNNLAVGFTDLGIMEEFNVEFINSKKEIIKNAAIVILETNLHEKVLSQIVADNPQQTYALDTASGQTANRAKSILPNLFILKTNEMEAQELSGLQSNAGPALVQFGVKHLFVTRSKNGLSYFNNSITEKYGSQKIKAANSNGAGDAFLSGIIYGFMKNQPPANWVKLGMTLAELTVQHEDTVNPNTSPTILESLIQN